MPGERIGQWIELYGDPGGDNYVRGHVTAEVAREALDAGPGPDAYDFGAMRHTWARWSVMGGQHGRDMQLHLCDGPGRGRFAVTEVPYVSAGRAKGATT